MNDKVVQNYVIFFIALILVLFGIDILQTGRVRNIVLGEERYVVGAFVIISGIYMFYLFYIGKKNKREKLKNK